MLNELGVVDKCKDLHVVGGRGLALGLWYEGVGFGCLGFGVWGLGFEV